MKLLTEFKEFAVKGNVVDLAVGVIIGAAFGKIVSSFVGDVIMPPLGLLTGGVDFKDLGWVLKPAVGTNPPVILKYGAFLQSVFDFLLIALAIFMMIQLINRLRHKAPQAAPEAPRQEVLLAEIRDALRAPRP